jgi:hypothetical protein
MRRMVQRIVLHWPNSLLNFIDFLLNGLHGLDEAI